MKLLVVGLLVCVFTGIEAQLNDDVQIPDEMQDDSISPLSWLDMISRLSELLQDTKEPDVDIKPLNNHTNLDQPIDDQTVEDEGNKDEYDITTTVVYEEVTVTNTNLGNISEDGGITELSDSETISSTVDITDGVQNNDGSIDSVSNVSTTNHPNEETPTSLPSVSQLLPFLNPKLSLKEALALFRDYQEQESLQGQMKEGGQEQEPHNTTDHTETALDHLAEETALPLQNVYPQDEMIKPENLGYVMEDGQKQEPQNSTNYIGTVLGHLGEETALSLQNKYPQDEVMKPETVGADDTDREGEFHNSAPAFSNEETESNNNFTLLSTNSTSSSAAASSGNDSQTDGPGMEISSLPFEVDTASQNDFEKQGNTTDVGMSSAMVSNKPLPPTTHHYAIGLDDDRISSLSTDHGVDEVSTELPREFWNMNLKGDDNDSNSKENDIYDDIYDMSSTSGYEDGFTERLTNITTPNCDWMGSNHNNPFTKLIDRLCHTLKPLPIIFNILILVTLGIISVVVCRIACLCIRCRRRKSGEEKDSLIEAGTRKEKKSLLQV